MTEDFHNPDAAFFAPDHDAQLWSLPPWITRYEVVDRPDGYDVKFVRVWLRAPQAAEIAGVDRALRPVPDRAHDLEFHNVGSSPPLGFWHFHPMIEAFEVEHDEDDGSAWWVRVWLRSSEAFLEDVL